MELRAPETFGIARSGIVEVGSGREVNGSELVGRERLVVDGNVVNQSAESVDKERT